MAVAEHKRAVRKAFSKSAPAYDSVADIQRQIASTLVQDLKIHSGNLVLDAGCGTGFLSRLLRDKEPSTRLIALDHALKMCLQSGFAQTVCADIESLPFQPECLDLYCSNLAWQWASPTLSTIEAARVLRKDGELAVATLGPATMLELRHAFSGVDDYQHVLAFHPPEEYCRSLVDAGFTDIRINTHVLKAHHPDLSSLVKSIRMLGARELGAKRRPGLIGRRAWLNIQTAYEELREPMGLPLSYDAIYLYARKA